MDGHRALIYSRVRKNKLNPADTDFARAERNQQVLQAVAGKLTSFGVLVKLPFMLRSPPTSRPALSSRSGGRSSGRARDGRSTAGSAASRAAARSSHRRRTAM
jgi:hypothetical protein